VIASAWRAAALAALTLAAGGTEAATFRHGGLYAFGDSLSDNGNAFAISQGVVPDSPPYFEGRFSNGYIWYDYVAPLFRRAGRETINYAVGGAQARTEFGDLIPDLPAQRRTFSERANPPPRSVATVWAGGNDLIGAVGSADMPDVARAAARSVVATAEGLRRDGIGTAIVFNLGDLADLPRYAGRSDAIRASATRGTRVYNATLDRGLDAVRARGMRVVELNVFATFKDIVRRPGAYGIANVRTPCITGELTAARNTCTPAQARVRAFADDIHPGRPLHRVLGLRVRNLLDPPAATASLAGAARGSAATPASSPAPVPVPASGLLLAAGLGAVGLVARRRRRA
jgi:outer membrane lipase/esterase